MLVTTIKPDGRVTEHETDRISYKELTRIVGGFIEYVSILDKASGKYHTMVVNENFLALGLPRNQAATDLYLVESRKAKAEGIDLDAEFKKRADALGAVVIDARTAEQKADPYIAGTVVVIPHDRRDVEKFIDFPVDPFDPCLVQS
jgi:hypothetical protein